MEQLVVVSRDVSEFIEARAPVLNPWTRVFFAPGQPQKPLERLDRDDLLEGIGQN